MTSGKSLISPLFGVGDWSQEGAFWDKFTLPEGLRFLRQGIIIVRRAGPGGADALSRVTLQSRGAKSTVVVAYRDTVLPKDVAGLKRRLRDALDAFVRRNHEPELAGAVLAIAISRASSSVREACIREGLGLFDLSGTMVLHDGPLYLHVEGTRPIAKKKQTTHLFRGAASRVLRILLSDPTQRRTSKQITELADLSGPYTWRVLEALEAEGFVSRKSPRTGYLLRDPQALLRAWMASGEKSWLTVESYNVSQTDQAFLLGGEHALTRAKADSAWTLSMATDDSFVFGLPVGLYFSGDSSVLVKTLGLRKVTPFNFLILRPHPDVANKTGGVYINGNTVPMFQLILDFHALGGRGEEQAEHLFQRWSAQLPVMNDE